MARIRLSDHARDDLDEIWLSIAVENMPAADRIIDEIDELMRKLLHFPEMGAERGDVHPGVPSFRCGKYVIFYRPMPYGIAIVRVVYGGRDLTKLNYPE